MNRTQRSTLSLALLAAGLLAGAAPAWADLRMCNTTGSRVGVAIGYRDGQGWITEGWWNLAPRACETLLRGTLAAPKAARTSTGNMTTPATAKRKKVMSVDCMPWPIPQRANTV